MFAAHLDTKVLWFVEIYITFLNNVRGMYLLDDLRNVNANGRNCVQITYHVDLWIRHGGYCLLRPDWTRSSIYVNIASLLQVNPSSGIPGLEHAARDLLCINRLLPL